MTNNNLESVYWDILNTEYNGKKIWEQFNQNNTIAPLTASIAFKGNKYSDSDLKLMVVGRAMNGWETDFSTCHTAKDVINTILGQEFSFADVINFKGFPREGRRPYRYITSKFWKLIKDILGEYGEANEEWYDETKNMNWNEKIVWSNLYKVSPRYEKNPDDHLIQKTIEGNIEIIKAEIAEYSPKMILFVTDKWYLEPSDKKPSFAKALNIKFINDSPSEIVVGYGKYGDSKIIVCKRPDIWGYTDQKVKTMAKEIKEAFDRI